MSMVIGELRSQGQNPPAEHQKRLINDSKQTRVFQLPRRLWPRRIAALEFTPAIPIPILIPYYDVCLYVPSGITQQHIIFETTKHFENLICIIL